jgi:carboxylesterase type B
MTVNIFRQKPEAEKKVPVAVYIHGGAYNRGSCKSFNITSQLFRHLSTWSSDRLTDDSLTSNDA